MNPSAIPLGILSADAEQGMQTPVEILERASIKKKSPSEYPPFIDMIKALMRKCEDEYRGRWKIFYGRGVKNEKFYGGEQYGRINAGGQWISMPRTTSDAYYVHNEFR